MMDVGLISELCHEHFEAAKLKGTIYDFIPKWLGCIGVIHV